MQELTDDQLDGLFRQSADAFDPPVDPVAWADMRNRLDAHDRTAPGPGWFNSPLLRRGLPLLLLLLLIGSGWYVWQQQPNGVSSVVAINRPNAPATPKTKSNATPTSTGTDRGSAAPVTPKRSISDQSRVRQPARITPNDVLAVTATSVPVSPNDITILTTTRPVNLPKADTQRGTNRLRVTRPIRSRREASQKQAAEAVPPTNPRTRSINPDETPSLTETASATLPKTVTEQTDLPVAVSLNSLAIRPGEWPALSGSIGRTMQVLDLPADHLSQPAVSSAVTQRGLSVRVVLAPDLSAVGLRNFARPGTNAGLLLEYRLTPRWSVQAGALWSEKIYNAKPGDYTWPAYQYWNVKPVGIEGRCNMIDVPLNIRYDFALRSRADGRQPSRWFASTGLTSYLILNERYHYNYAWPDDPAIKVRETPINDASRYGFSQLNVSAGYERALSRRLSWQVEPFMKIPLKQVGFYKINLLSTGAFVSLRYKL